MFVTPQLLCILAFLPSLINAFSLFSLFGDSNDHTPEEIAAWIDLPDNYQTLPAADKSELLFAKILGSKYVNNQLPEWNTGVGYIFQVLQTGVLSLAPAFTCNVNNSDILPVNRVRGIHNLGVVGSAQWKMLDNVMLNNFTGLLAKGSTAPVIIRLSLATPPATNGLVPGIGVKLLIDGRPSVNTVANFDLDGQGDNKNFFLNPFRTTLPAPTQLAKKILAMRFEQIESPALSLPVRDLARFTPQGSVIENPVYPFMLEFRPDPRVANLISSDSAKETRIELVEKLSAGPFLHVYAASGLDDANAFKIGELSLQSNVWASSFGDERLCFKHQRHTPKHDEF